MSQPETATEANDREQRRRLLTWKNAEAIVNRPEVHEAFQTFSHDSTEDNAIGVALAVLAAAQK